MEFLKLDINHHDLDKVADLIYETEPELFSLLFGKKKNKALPNIKKVVQAGQNSFGYDFIYIAIEKEDILGLTIIYRGNEIDKKIESNRFTTSLDFFSLIRLIIIELIFVRRLLTGNIDEQDLYISNICVDAQHRGKGIGTFLLENIIKQAEKNQCRSIILDASKEKKPVISLYEKHGFEIVESRSILFGSLCSYKMIKKL